MKREMFKYMLPVLAAAVFYSGSAYSNSSAAGNTVTVNRDSMYNALRSPALMSWQQDDSIGLGCVYSLQAYYNLDGSVESFGVEVPVDGEKKSVFKGTGLLSLVLRSGMHSFGIGIRNTDDSQYAISETDISINHGASDTDEREEQINVSSMFSYSYRLSNRQSLGIQVETGYIKKMIDKDTNEGAIYRYSDSTTQRICGSVSFGYSIIGRNFEAGFLINSGEFSREKTDVSYERNNTLPYSGNAETDPEIYQNKGYGIMAGFGFRPFYNLLLNFEAGTQFPYDYEKKSISDDFVKVNNESHSKGIYLVKVGADYMINRSISAGIGADYIYASAENQISNNVSESTNFSLFEVTTGIEYRLLNGIKILVSGSIVYTVVNMSMERPATAVEINPEILYVNFVTGISMKF